MIDINDYIPLVTAAIPRFRNTPPDTQQQDCILFDRQIPMIIAAGPGTGKTTTLVLRALRLVFVDDLLPEQILITTFTKKAAAEIRGRLLEWGLLIRTYLQNNLPTPTPSGYQQRLNSIDVNRFITDTLDSICEEIITRYRHPSDPPLVLVEEFVANSALTVNGLLPNGAEPNPGLDTYLSRFTRDGTEPSNFGEKVQVARTLIDRFTHDQVDINSYRANQADIAARTCIADSADSYHSSMLTDNKIDFAQLENMFLTRLSNNRLDRFVDGVRAILVDEYQDTNPIQESIYFELARRSHASFTIVGDDDQSLYRFRGATVELFRDFVSRFHSMIPGYPQPQLKYLVNNYRSTPEIINHFNNFIQNDPAYLPARIQPPKPLIASQLPSIGIPVLGLFRNDATSLANNLFSILWAIFRSNGYPINIGGNQINLIRDPINGDFGDCAFLSHTVDEFAHPWGNNPPRRRLPVLMRELLESNGVNVYNPRGRDLRDIPVVQQLLGTMLECIDCNSIQQNFLDTNHKLRHEAVRNLNQWRMTARNFIASNPPPNINRGIGNFVNDWQNMHAAAHMQWPTEWPLLELCFKIITWIPLLHDDPEGQVYTEAISRCISQAASFSPFRSSIVFSNPYNAQIHQSSVRRSILDIFSQIAENHVAVDEEIMPYVPRSRLPFMTIHQAKGLEFPITIVDISSDYSADRPVQRFRRYPTRPSSVECLEDDLAPHCQIGPLRTARNALDRTFDDIKRLYYVAYSRPQFVLILVGLNPCLRYNTTIKHIATGWSANGNWAWRLPVPGNAPPLVNNIPITLI